MNPSPHPAPPPSARWAIGLLLMAYIALATAWNVVVPVFEAPDEHTHYFFAQHLATTGELPLQTLEVDQRGPWEQEGSQPPLYYALVAPLIRFAGARIDEDDLRYNDQNSMGVPTVRGNENRFVHDPAEEASPWRGYILAVRLARGVSTVLGAAAVLAIWALARRVFVGGGRESLALATAAIVAFNPQWLHLSAALTNDAAIVSLSAAALWLLLRMADGDDDRWTRAGLALVVGLAPLAKLSGLALLAFTIGTLGWLAWRRRDVRWLAGTAGPVLVAAAVLSGWWYARNVALYGSLTGLDYMLPEGVGRTFNPERWIRGLPGELLGIWRSTWGIFGWFTIMLPGWAYATIDVLMALAVVGIGRALWNRPSWIRLPRIVWLAVWGAMLGASLLRWLTLVKGGHGRLLFPAIAFLGIALVTGWRALLPGAVSSRWLALVVSLVMVGAATVTLAGVVVPAFARPASIDRAHIPDSAQRVDAVFDDRLRLHAVEHPPRARAGENLPVRLYWEVLQPIERPGYVAIRIDPMVAMPGLPPPGERPEIASLPTLAYLAHPGHGTAPLDTLEPGQVIVDRHWVPVPDPVNLQGLVSDDMAPGEHRAPIWSPAGQPTEANVAVHVYDVEASGAWPAVGSDVNGDDVLRRVVVQPSARAAVDTEGSVPLAEFGSERDLHLSILENATQHDGQLRTVPLDDRDGSAPVELPLLVRLPIANDDAYLGGRFAVRWDVRRPRGEDLALMVHLVDGSGDLVMTFDGDPATHGRYPTSRWQAGEHLIAEIPWAIGRHVLESGHEGPFELRVGMYERTADAPRVPAYRPGGERWQDDAVPLARITFDGAAP